MNGPENPKTKSETWADILRNEYLDSLGGRIVVWALIAEGANGIGMLYLGSSHISDGFNILFTFAIAVGVFMEIRYGGRALAGLHVLLQTAQLETAKLRYKMLGRGVEPEQADKIAKLAPSFTWPRESAIQIYFIPGDAESNRFAIQLRWALEDAGITTGISSHTSSLSEPIYGLNVCGQEGPHGEHARKLADILVEAGFDVGGAHSDELPSILVGVNPPPT